MSCLLQQRGGFTPRQKGHGTSSVSTRFGTKSRERVVGTPAQFASIAFFWWCAFLPAAGRSLSSLMEVPGRATQPGCEASSPPLHPTSTRAEARSAAPRITAPGTTTTYWPYPCPSCSNPCHNAPLWCNTGVYPHHCISAVAAHSAASLMG